MPRILYTAASGARTKVDRTEAEIAAMFSTADRATSAAGGALSCDCGPPLGTVTITTEGLVARASAAARIIPSAECAA